MSYRTLSKGAKRRVISFVLLLAVYVAGTTGLTFWQIAANASHKAGIAEPSENEQPTMTLTVR